MNGLLMLAAVCFLPGQLVLVDQGQPRAVIAVPERPGKELQAAAQDLAWHFERMSGARLPIKPETQLSDVERQAAVVAIGPTELARQSGIRVEELAPEAFLIRTQGKRLFLVGHEGPAGRAQSAATGYAVASLLADDLGVRWLWPGELGTIVPQRRSISLPAIDRRHQPPLAGRKIRNAITNSKFTDGMRRVPTDPARYRQMIDESIVWQQRMGLGSRIEISAGHAFTAWYASYHKEHPDYFALHLNGSREWTGRALGDAGKNGKLCVSNPEVVRQWIANVRQSLAKDPSLACFSASPNDGYYTGHCTCPNCRAWDVPSAPERYTYFDVDARGAAAYEYVSLSDRYLRFFNRCAEELVKFAPDKFVGGYAYGTWRSVPRREKVHPNVIIGFVGLGYFDQKRRADDLRYWDGWSKAAKRLYLRPNLLHGGDAFPAVYVHKLAADLRHCRQTGMISTDFDSLVHHWATQGLNYYVLARLLWDPAADVDRLVDDYCRSGFGPAAGAVKDYFAALERLTDKIAGEFSDASEVVAGEQKKLGATVNFFEAAARWYTPEVVAGLAEKLSAAQRAAAGDPQSLARVKFLREGLRYAELRAPALKLRDEFRRLSADAKDRAAKRQELARSLAAIKSYYVQQATTRVIAPQLVRMTSDEMPQRPAK